jgi:hypothetical protein
MTQCIALLRCINAGWPKRIAIADAATTRNRATVLKLQAAAGASQNSA